jgi:hypothetical protein
MDMDFLNRRDDAVDFLHAFADVAAEVRSSGERRWERGERRGSG